MLSEAVKLELIIWNTHGYWPKTTNRYRLFLYNSLTLFLFIFDAILYIVTMGISAFTTSNLDELSDTLFLLLTLLAMIPKYLTIICRRDTIKRLLKFLDSDDLIQDGDDQINDLIKESIKNGKNNTYTIFLIATCAQLLMYSAPLMTQEERRLPYRAWYGLEDNSISPWYELFYLYQVVGCFIHCNMNVSMDTLPCAVLAVAGGQLDVLAYYIRKLGEPGTDPEKQHARLQNCIKFHLNINKLLKDVEDIFRISWFVQFLLSGMVICITGFQMSVDSVKYPVGFGFCFDLQSFNNRDLLHRIRSLICIHHEPQTVVFYINFNVTALVSEKRDFHKRWKKLSPTADTAKYAALVCYLAAMVFMAFMPCRFGNEIILKSDNLRNAAFSCQWPDANQDFKKKICIFMECTKEPIRLYAGKMLELSLSTFSLIINSAYRYYAVLQHMKNLENH